MRPWHWLLSLCVVAMMSLHAGCGETESSRQVIRLDGTWQVSQGAMDTMPKEFDREVPVPGLMDMGIDVLQALQFSAANMDPRDLKDKFGSRLSFEGGMCVQKVLPFGSTEEVRAECRRLISILGNKGGYLCGPSHFIQAGTPAANIAAFFDEALGYYPFSI